MYYHLYKGNDSHLTQRMILQNTKSQKKKRRKDKEWSIKHYSENLRLREDSQYNQQQIKLKLNCVLYSDVT